MQIKIQFREAAEGKILGSSPQHSSRNFLDFTSSKAFHKNGRTLLGELEKKIYIWSKYLYCLYFQVCRCLSHCFLSTQTRNKVNN